MENKLIILGLCLFTLISCSKKIEQIMSGISKNGNTETSANTYVQYTISEGRQYCDKRRIVSIKDSLVSFKVKFDSSAIYTTSDASNQLDINKLFGFSDNNNADHHQYSARFGWRWSDHALRLFAYVYNKGVMSFKEIGSVQIGAENTCVIKAEGDKYLFSLNGAEITMPRASATALAEGYKLWPYFGGDESAPHTISIWIKEIAEK
jgi:hypothetical protein